MTTIEVNLRVWSVYLVSVCLSVCLCVRVRTTDRANVRDDMTLDTVIVHYVLHVPPPISRPFQPDAYHGN